MRKLGILLKNNLFTTFGISKLKKTQPIKLVGYLVLALYIIGSFFITLTGGAKIIADALEKYNMIVLMLILFFIMTGFMLFNLSIYNAKSNLFNAKDNDLLLSLPIRSNTILASRLLQMIIWNLLLSLLMLVPAICVYATRVPLSFSFYLIILICFLLLPIIPTILASLIGYFIAYLTSKVNSKSFIEIILSFAFVGLIYYFMANGQYLLSIFISNQETMLNVLKWVFYPIYLIYETFISNNYWALLGYVAINLGIFILFVMLLNKNYKNIINKLQENKIKTNYVMKNMNVNSPTKALFMKEIKRYFSSPIYVLNTSFGVIILIVVAGATFFYNIDQILKVMNVSIQGVSIFELIMIMIIFIVFISSTTSAAISLEGRSFWIVKSLPVDTIKILDSKILLNILLVLPITFISIIIFKFTLSLSIIQTILLIIVSTISEFVAAQFGLLINLKFPKMDATSDVVIVKRSASVMIAILVPMVIIFSFAGIYGEVIKLYNFNIIIAVIIALITMMAIIERIILIKWGTNKFRNID